ncbi:F-box protein SKIP16 isoform X1 [Vitis vinifera]|uniref:ApaG domain-containing protein n=1 Tax=Vitis vinifera TaxID=29760 RepID=F6HYW9_VITVI|nr:F-box protein SKIP16 isoform X1 [Vitis vinifera]|eukprot:XP_002271000.1 PREDICTED: F-box protein SKIP16 isoform X1 [Vitis vinifera]
MEMGLEDLGDLAINAIISKLDTKDTVAVSCVSKKLRVSASEESLWLNHCSQDLGLSAPIDPLGKPAPSFKETYRLWRESFGMYPWPLVKRVKRCWDRLKNWLSANFPEADATLRKGATEVEIEALENILKVKLPLPTRLLYRFCDGQELTDDVGGTALGSSLGIIGGYCFYDHLVNVCLLPLRQVILETKEITDQLGFSTTSKYVIVAASSTYIGKFFFLNCTTGQLYVGTRSLVSAGEMIPCVPNALISPMHDSNTGQQQDAMLLWLEEHVRRLQNGIIKLRNEGMIRSINLFPEESPLCSTAVTNGVQVRASAVFIPEGCNLLDESHKYLFAYSIRMRLLPEGCIVNGTSFGSCQLNWRHWIIRANDHVVSEVNAEAVIGKYPLLYPGGEEFVYESCTPLSSSQGSIEGAFTFVPGRLADPKGSAFEVEVGRFPLQCPDYIF